MTINRNWGVQMLNTSENMSALEWFFRKPSASNFPQDTSSPVLRQLSSATKQLSAALHGANVTDLSDHSLNVATWVGRISAQERIEKTDVNGLIQEVGDVINVARKREMSEVPKNVTESLNATVIALALLAKTSQDIGFRNEVIALAKSLVPTQDGVRATNSQEVAEKAANV